MKAGLIVFLLALFARFVNLLILPLDVESYIFEDQRLYWGWSLKNAYLPWGEISKDLLSERMPGSFLFFEFLQWITNKSLFFILLFQSILDSFTCVVIYKCAYLINKKYSFYTGLFASFSPLLIIISSQILSDTLFLFTFSLSLLYLLKYSKPNSSQYNIYISGLMLGISCFIRAAAFPLIFLCLPIIFFLIKSHKLNNIKAMLIILIFTGISLAPVSNRLMDNIINHDSISLTSQTGAHAAYWVVPGILSMNDNFNREQSIEYMNLRIQKKGGTTNKPYVDSKKMMSVSLEVLYEQKLTDIIYGWSRSLFLNIVAPSILIDSRVRNLEHFSFAEEGKISTWIKKNLEKNESIKYLIVLIISLFFATFTFFSLIIGFYCLVKDNIVLSILALFIILYFCVITGPTLSPKYSMPFIPILLYFQAIFIDKLFLFCKRRY
jgi:4-amino-4-deoxy-L-arabinose transferase-like glycosyltransferase